MVPNWLHILSMLSLAIAVACAGYIANDVIRRPQKMWIMNIVWPVSALFGSVIALAGYQRFGRLAAQDRVQAAPDRDENPSNGEFTPFAAKVGKGSAHCGSGCTLGDICAEWLVYAAPVVATWFGWQSLFQEKIFAVWIVDYLFAFIFGIAFQYFTIKPMRDLSAGKALAAAVKADAASLTAWQVGMYGFMAIAHFYIFGSLLNATLAVDMPEFWFMMQIAMLAGFVTSYPVNWWLIRAGIKEAM